MKIDVKGLRKKDFGSFVYRVIAYSLILCGVLLCIQKDVSQSLIYTGLKILMLIVSVGFFICFSFNARSRFRPGWTLPTAVLLFIVGVLYIGALIFKNLSLNVFGATTLILILTAFNTSLLISTAVQLKALTLNRWVVFLLLFIANAAFGIILFLNLWNLRQTPAISVAIYMFLIATQSFLEGIY